MTLYLSLIMKIPPMTYSGNQRKGVIESFSDASSPVDFADRACHASFPLATPFPLPRDVSDALDFASNNSDELVNAFRNRQLSILEDLAIACEAETSRWYSFTPPFLAPATMTFHVALCAHLSDFLGINAIDWLMQFAVGFPLTGTLSQRFTFPLDTSTALPPVHAESLFATKTTRFVSRARRSSAKNAAALWNEAMSQVQEGWLTPPEILDTAGNFANDPLTPCNVAFRFGVQQEDKLRGCDDLKDSLTNTACRVASPITLCGWDHIAEASLRLTSAPRDWVFGKVDHRAAYKFLPIREDDSRFAVIALWNPDTEDWFGFRPRTQLFGATASVLHYNCFSRLLTTLLVRLLRLPLFGYFDDFGFFTSKAEASATLLMVLRLCELLRIPLKQEKSEIGQFVTFLGLAGYFPCPANGMSLRISLAPAKAAKWADSILNFLRQRFLPHSALEALIGRLNFAQSTTFNRFARGMLKPLYLMLYSRPYDPVPSPLVRRTLVWWFATLTSIPPRIIRPRSPFPDYVLFTDASYEESPLVSGIAAILFRGASQFLEGSRSRGQATLPVVAVYTRDATPDDIAHFRDTSVIYGLELFAAVAAIFSLRYQLRGCSITVYIDNNAALSALIKGDSCSMKVARLIAFMWYISATFDITLWFERVSSALNIADLPSRGVKLPSPITNPGNLIPHPPNIAPIIV